MNVSKTSQRRHRQSRRCFGDIFRRSMLGCGQDDPQLNETAQKLRRDLKASNQSQMTSHVHFHCNSPETPLIFSGHLKDTLRPAVSGLQLVSIPVR